MNSPIEPTGLRRPKTRAECANGVRPCPWVGCRHHLYLEVNAKTGTIRLNFPNVNPWDLEETCALDVADDGPHILEDIGRVLGLRKERVRQVEAQASGRIATTHSADAYGVPDMARAQRARWQGAYSMALALGCGANAAAFRQRITRGPVANHWVEERDGLYRAIPVGEQAPGAMSPDDIEQARIIQPHASLAALLGMNPEALIAAARKPQGWAGWVFRRETIPGGDTQHYCAIRKEEER